MNTKLIATGVAAALLGSAAVLVHAAQAPPQSTITIKATVDGTKLIGLQFDNYRVITGDELVALTKILASASGNGGGGGWATIRPELCQNPVNMTPDGRCCWASYTVSGRSEAQRLLSDGVGPGYTAAG